MKYNLYNGAELPAPVIERHDGVCFELGRGKTYCQADSGFCSTCDAGEDHNYDELQEAGICQDLEFVDSNGLIWVGKLSRSDSSQSFGWWEELYTFRPVNTPAEIVKKIRRRCEDSLRKSTPEMVYEIAKLLGVKTE